MITVRRHAWRQLPDWSLSLPTALSTSVRRGGYARSMQSSARVSAIPSGQHYSPPTLEGGIDGSLHVEPAAARTGRRNGGAARRRDGGRGPRGRTAGSAAPAAGCSVCGKNLVLNPGAESGEGLTATGTNGAVPHWTSTEGQFGAAAYTGFGVGWFSASSKGPADKGKNYFFGGTTTAATSAKASIGSQTIKLPQALPDIRRHSAAGSGTTARIPPVFARRSPTRRGRR